MAVDKLVDSTQLDADLTAIADAIRLKGGTSADLAFPADFVSAIGDIPTGGGGSVGPITGSFTPTENIDPNNYYIELGQACRNFFIVGTPTPLYGTTVNPNGVRTFRQGYYFMDYDAVWGTSGTNSGNSGYAGNGTGNTTNRVQFSGTRVRVACRIDTNGGGYYRAGVEYKWFAW